jgi:hypothetical protein
MLNDSSNVVNTSSSPALISGALPTVNLGISLPRSMLLRAMMSTSDPTTTTTTTTTTTANSDGGLTAKSRSGRRRSEKDVKEKEVRDAREPKDKEKVGAREIGMKPSTSNPLIEAIVQQPSPTTPEIIQSGSTLSSPTSSGSTTMNTTASVAVSHIEALILKQLPKTITASENFRTSLADDPMKPPLSPSGSNTTTITTTTTTTTTTTAIAATVAISKPPPTLEIVQAVARATSPRHAQPHQTNANALEPLAHGNPSAAFVSPFTSPFSSPFASPRDVEITRKLSSNMIQYRLTKRAASLPRLVSGSSIDLLANGAVEIATTHVDAQGTRANDELPRPDSPYSRQRLNMSGSQKKDKDKPTTKEKPEKDKEKEKREVSGGRKPRRRRSASVTTAPEAGGSSDAVGGSGGVGGSGAHVTQSSDALVPLLAPLMDRLTPGGKPQSADRLLHSLHKSRQAQLLLLGDKETAGTTAHVTGVEGRVGSPHRIRRSSSTKSFSSTTRAFSCDGDDDEFEDEEERIFFQQQAARRVHHLDLASSSKRSGGGGIHGSHPSTDSSSKAMFIAGSGGLCMCHFGGFFL